MKYFFNAAMIAMTLLFIACGNDSTDPIENDSAKPETDVADDTDATLNTEQDIVVTEKEETDEVTDNESTNKYPEFEGVWKMDTQSIKEVASTDCIALVKNGVVAKPYRKITKIDATHAKLEQCEGDDASCPKVQYEIGSFDYADDTISGPADVVEILGPYCVKSHIEPNVITFTSNGTAEVKNLIHTVFYIDNQCSKEATTYPKPCDYNIEYKINKVQ